VADDVLITAGTGTTIATDQVGTRHFQLFKPAFGALDAATLVAATDPLPARIPKVSAATVTSVADNAASTQLLASNTARSLVTIVNTSSAALFVKYGTGATITTSFTVKLNQFDYWEMPEPIYTGVIHGIWATDPGDGAAVITEA